jgi:hypothetical protein
MQPRNPNESARQQLAPSRTEMLANAIDNGSDHAPPSPDNTLGQTIIVGHLLGDIERRLATAEGTAAGHVAKEDPQAPDPSGLIARGRSNLERLNAISSRLNDLLNSIGI